MTDTSETPSDQDNSDGQANPDGEVLGALLDSSATLKERVDDHGVKLAQHGEQLGEQARSLAVLRSGFRGAASGGSGCVCESAPGGGYTIRTRRGTAYHYDAERGCISRVTPKPAAPAKRE